VTGRLGVVALAIAAFLTVPAASSVAATDGNRIQSISAPAAVEHAPPARELAASYARREAAATTSLAQFQGAGSGVYIGGSTLGIVLLIVILVILL
jgi:hypothetical protein